MIVGVVVAAAVGLVSAQSSTNVETLQLRPNVWMIAGAGANVAVQVGVDGVVVVDSGTAATAPAILAEIQKITKQPIRYVINTSADEDHVGGNQVLSKAGETLLGTRVTGLPGGGTSYFGSDILPASILSVEAVLTRMSAATAQRPAYPATAWPTETFEFGRKNMFLNGEGIEVVHQPSAHSDGDSIVFFRKSDVIVAGDIVDAERFPAIDVARGGSIQGELDALNRLTALAIPSVPIAAREEGTLVISGHGHVFDQFDVVNYRDMLTIIRDRVRDMIAAGMTLDQVKAAGPAKGYAGRYGAQTGPNSTNSLIEAVYRSLSRGKL